MYISGCGQVSGITRTSNLQIPLFTDTSALIPGDYSRFLKYRVMCYIQLLLPFFTPCHPNTTDELVGAVTGQGCLTRHLRSAARVGYPPPLLATSSPDWYIQHTISAKKNAAPGLYNVQITCHKLHSHCRHTRLLQILQILPYLDHGYLYTASKEWNGDGFFGWGSGLAGYCKITIRGDFNGILSDVALLGAFSNVNGMQHPEYSILILPATSYIRFVHMHLILHSN